MTGQDLIEQVLASRAVDPGQSQDGPAIRSIGLQDPLGPEGFCLFRGAGQTDASPTFA